jgi:hypothetical protein
MEANKDSAIHFELLAERRKADENEYLDMVVNEWKTHVAELQEQLETAQLDAQRYRKLKAWLVDKQEGRWIRIGSHYLEKAGPSIDGAVDDLPDVETTP